MTDIVTKCKTCGYADYVPPNRCRNCGWCVTDESATSNLKAALKMAYLRELFREELSKIEWIAEGHCAGGSTGTHVIKIWPELMDKIIAATPNEVLMDGSVSEKLSSGGEWTALREALVKQVAALRDTPMLDYSTAWRLGFKTACDRVLEVMEAALAAPAPKPVVPASILCHHNPPRPVPDGEGGTPNNPDHYGLDRPRRASPRKRET